MNIANDGRQQRRDRENLQFRDENPLVVRNGNRVRYDDFPNTLLIEAFKRLPDEDAVRDGDIRRVRARFVESARLLNDAPACDDVVNDDGRFVTHVTDDFQYLHVASADAASPFVHVRNRKLEHSRVLLGEFRASGVRRDDNRIRELLRFEIIHDGRRGSQMFHRDVKKALNLSDVQVDGHDAICARSRQQIGDKPRADRLASRGFSILTRVAVIRDDGGQLTRGRSTECVEHNAQFHEVFVDGSTRRLDDEDIRAANALLDLYVRLGVGEGV